MKSHQPTEQDGQDDTCTEPLESDRRKDHRRTHACEGYAYIEMVGWMDRREKIRRDNDPSCF